MASAPVSHDTLFSGRLLCRQSRDGYRFSIDAVLLAHFCQPRRRDHILDLGSGCGVIALILAYRHLLTTLTCLELQPSLADHIRHNIAHNDLAQRMTVVEGDLRAIRTLVGAGTFDTVVANPPYYPLGSGRQNPAGEQALARHELSADLPQIIQAAAFALRNKGQLAMVYPASRGAVLISLLRAQGLEPKRLRAVHPYPGAEANLLLIEAVKNGGEQLTVLPSLHVHDRPGGDYTPEVTACYAADEGCP